MKTRTPNRIRKTLISLSALAAVVGPLASSAHAGGGWVVQPAQTPCTNDTAPCIAAWIAPVAPDGTFTVTGYVHNPTAPRISIAIWSERTHTVIRYENVASVPMTGEDYAGYSQFRAVLPMRPGGATYWGYRSDLGISAQAIVKAVAGPESNVVHVYSPGFSL